MPGELVMEASDRSSPARGRRATALRHDRRKNLQSQLRSSFGATPASHGGSVISQSLKNDAKPLFERSNEGIFASPVIVRSPRAQKATKKRMTSGES